MSNSNNSFFDSNFIAINQQIILPILEEKKVELFIKREDLIHPFVSGNKFRKLKYNLLEAKKLKKKALLTFGGAYENGMKLQFVTREQYRQKSSFGFIEKMKNKWGDFYLIPEGGTNCLAVDGCEEILIDEDSKFDYICSAVGTGGTISGLINSSKKHQKIIGFPALKGNFLSEEIRKFISRKKNWSLQKSYHFGGYAKHTEELIDFINTFKEETGVLLDPVYTGKMLFGILDLVKKDTFEEGSKILAIHTGGIQGIVGFNQKLSKKNQEVIHI